MGNQREVRQVSPSTHLGVAIPIRRGFAGTVASLLAQNDQGHFYTYIAPPDEHYTIPNMDFDRTPIGSDRESRFIIQSGGKMWCGYEEFCNHIASVAQYLEDARFFIGDEKEFIDEFEIIDGKLNQQRVHSGYWRPVDEYLRERYPEVEI